MNRSVITTRPQLTLVIPIKVIGKRRICLKVMDYNRQKTVFTDRSEIVEGNRIFRVMMPITAKKLLVLIYDESAGNLKSDPNIIINPWFEEEPLKTRMDVVNIGNGKIRDFIEFAERFAFNMPYLATGKTYRSDDKRFFIEYLPAITDANGNELTTPARIAKDTGVIQVSAKQCSGYTVPMIMAILLHEYCHYNVSSNIDDESEADLNGLLIYLGLGFPRIEAREAWLDVFQDANTKQNQERMKLIERFINDFDNNKI